uniref:Testis ecdysiotropin peptide C n=1 Tax=Lymantria dispar TaxID=13123 RepID=ECDC_LYMDI|nr:RecName: Full=Testis ecdysiotropin peptide C; Short=TE [Lymantria dispar]
IAIFNAYTPLPFAD